MDGVFSNDSYDGAMADPRPRQLQKLAPAAAGGPASRPMAPPPSDMRVSERSLDRAGFAPEDALLARQAVGEACSFFEGIRVVTPAKRRQIAIAVLHHVGTGLRDPHRLALKAIVRAG